MNNDLIADQGTIHVVMPIGVGLKMDVSKKMQIGLEAGLRMPFTDYLDGISQAGNPDGNDTYFMSGLSLIYMMKK